MAIKEVHLAGYRSIRDLRFRLKNLNVVTGANGCGKSNLYKALSLIARCAQGGLARSIAIEGGMPSILWAGRKTGKAAQGPVRVGFSISTDRFSYEIRLGLPIPGYPFRFDPHVKEEFVWYGERRRPSNTLFERSLNGAWVQDANGKRNSYAGELLPSESILTQLREPRLYPELFSLRQEIAQWRFYDYFRVDPESPIRRSQIGSFTPILNHDGSDLAAALRTIWALGDWPRFCEAVATGLAGGQAEVVGEESELEVQMRMPGVHRPFSARELSDGTLRYLCLLAALLSPEPAAVLILNEPENSLHPDLMKPLAKLIVAASQKSQVWVTTHSEKLAAYLDGAPAYKKIELFKTGDGETQIEGQGLILEDN